MTTEYEIPTDELVAMLKAYEGPPTARPVPRPARPRRWVLAAPAVAACAIAAAAAVLVLRDGSPATGPTQQTDPSALQHVELPALPPGPDVLPPSQSLGIVAEVTLDDAIAQADAIFVGTVTAIGGTETTVDGLETQRVRYAVERVLRGQRVDTVDVTSVVSIESSFPAEVGSRYLVLAEETMLGEAGAAILVPVGAAQGVYVAVGGTATNGLTGEPVEIEDVARRVAAADGSR